MYNPWSNSIPQSKSTTLNSTPVKLNQTQALTRKKKKKLPENARLRPH